MEFIADDGLRSTGREHPRAQAPLQGTTTDQRASRRGRLDGSGQPRQRGAQLLARLGVGHRSVEARRDTLGGRRARRRLGQHAGDGPDMLREQLWSPVHGRVVERRRGRGRRPSPRPDAAVRWCGGASRAGRRSLLRRLLKECRLRPTQSPARPASSAAWAGPRNRAPMRRTITAATGPTWRASVASTSADHIVQACQHGSRPCSWQNWPELAEPVELASWPSGPGPGPTAGAADGAEQQAHRHARRHRDDGLIGDVAAPPPGRSSLHGGRKSTALA